MTPAQTQLFTYSTCDVIAVSALKDQLAAAQPVLNDAEGRIEGFQWALSKFEPFFQTKDRATNPQILPDEFHEKLRAVRDKIRRLEADAKHEYDLAQNSISQMDFLSAGSFPVLRMTMAPRDLFALYEEQALRKSIVFHKDIMLSVLSASIAQRTGHIIATANFSEIVDWTSVMAPYYDSVLDYDIETEIVIYAQVKDAATAQSVIANW